jgi:lipopolysaccharide transport system ATP-binding protein
MSNMMVSIENVSKLYRLGEINTSTYYGDMKRWWARLRGFSHPLLDNGEADQNDRGGKTIWALKDVNFSVYQDRHRGS